MFAAFDYQSMAKQAEITRRVAAKVVASWVGATAQQVAARWGKVVDVGRLVRECWERPEVEIAQTYRELAERLPLQCADPERTLKQYTARGMPGKPARAGRRDGRFDVEVCRTWIAAHVRGAPATDKRERLLKLDLEIKEREKLEQLERLADVDEVAAWEATCVANSRAILEAIPDEVLSQLEGIDEGRRRTIHQVVSKLVDTAFEELARLNESDTDPTEDEETTPTSHAPAARKVG